MKDGIRRLLYARTRKESMKYAIRQLLNDKDELAELMVHAKFNELSIGFYDVNDGTQISSAITAEKNQFSSREAAFAALFKRLLFGDYEWDIDKEMLTPDGKWMELFKERWIDEYFSDFEKLPFSSADASLLVDCLTYDLTKLNEPDSKSKAFLKSLTNVDAILVKKGYIYRLFFGESDHYYFLYDYDLYD